jgi:hypothetical protein
MRKLRILALVHLVTGAITALLAIAFTGISVLGSPPGEPRIFPWLGVAFAIKAAPSLVLAWGLFALKPWSRMLGIVLSVLHLPLFPIGTVIGIVGLMVLYDAESRAVLSGDLLRQPEHMAY